MIYRAEYEHSVFRRLLEKNEMFMKNKIHQKGKS